MPGPDQERSEPTPAEVALRLARNVSIHYGGGCGCGHGEGKTCAPHKAIAADFLPILTRLVEATERAAKREALLSVVRAGCRYCAESGPTLNASALARSARWIHMEGKYLAFCEQPAVHDALSALESSGEAK